MSYSCWHDFLIDSSLSQISMIASISLNIQFFVDYLFSGMHTVMIHIISSSVLVPHFTFIALIYGCPSKHVLSYVKSTHSLFCTIIRDAIQVFHFCDPQYHISSISYLLQLSCALTAHVVYVVLSDQWYIQFINPVVFAVNPPY